MNKKCGTCKTLKEKDKFHRNNKALDGLQNNCKLCNNAYLKKYNYNRRRTDLNFKLLYNLRTRLRLAIKLQFKKGKTIKELGCTIEELRTYLESKFLNNMTWNNYGNKKGQWSIDHIIPLKSFNLSVEEERKLACNYKNLQPLWVEDNIKKGSKA